MATEAHPLVVSGTGVEYKSLLDIAEAANRILKHGEYVGHIAVSAQDSKNPDAERHTHEEGFIIFVDTDRSQIVHHPSGM